MNFSQNPVHYRGLGVGNIIRIHDRRCVQVSFLTAQLLCYNLAVVLRYQLLRVYVASVKVMEYRNCNRIPSRGDKYGSIKDGYRGVSKAERR